MRNWNDTCVRESLVKPSPDTYDVLPPSPTDWNDQPRERSIVPVRAPGIDFPAGSPVASGFWGPDVRSAVSPPGVHAFGADPLSNRDSGGVLSKSMRVFGCLAMALAVLVVVLDYLFDDQKSSVLAANVVGAMFTLGVFLVAPRK
jgi:hypothetical protein